jgi:hypothetical protein
MDVDESHEGRETREDDETGGEASLEDDEQPLARVRYGLAKELRLYPDALVIMHREERDELRFELDTVRRLILSPGEYTPSKLVLMLELADGETVVAEEAMTNARDFRVLIRRLHEIRPEIELDPPNMDEQLMQALDIKRRTQIGCYGVVLGACLLAWVVYLIVAYIGAHAPH